MTTPTNTSRDQQLPEAVLGGDPDAILAQEKNGQAELLASDVLPVHGIDHKELEALGFRFGDQVAGDELFRQATLPKGWRRDPDTEHSMWSYLLDERGIRRVAIFYKAAFYDRRADMHLAYPGQDAARAYIYGSDENPIHPQFTIDELDQMRVFAEGYLEDARQHPEIYDADGRAKNLIRALDRHAAKNRQPRSVR